MLESKKNGQKKGWKLEGDRQECCVSKPWTAQRGGRPSSVLEIGGKVSENKIRQMIGAIEETYFPPFNRKDGAKIG